jgi:hypothetical protein
MAIRKIHLKTGLNFNRINYRALFASEPEKGRKKSLANAFTLL